MTNATKRGRTLRSDARGAVLVIGVFVAPFLVGALYYLIALSTAAMQREGLQGAADASAFAPAVVSARAMNQISVMNVLMKCIMAVVLPTRALLPAYRTVASWDCADPCTCSIVRDAGRASGQLSQISSRLERRASDLLTGLSDAQKALAQRVPQLGRDAANASAARTPTFLRSPRADVYSPSLAKDGCRLGLPVEEDSFREVCRRAKPYVWELALRIAGPSLHTMGACLSGGPALGLAAGDLSNPEGRVCREAASPPCSGGGPHPKKVWHEAKNGSDWMQYWAEVKGRDFDRARRGVEIAASEARAGGGGGRLDALNLGFAQAEIFYDCAASWDALSCNGEENAMWDVRWTARLRRVHRPSIRFTNDAYVKDTLANPGYWQNKRGALMSARHPPPNGAAGMEAGMLRASPEGPLQ